MKTLSLLFVVFMAGLALAACAPAATPTPTPDAQATVTAIAANVLATETANAPTATDTPTITNTPLPTDTPRPTATDTPRPSATDTPRPSTPVEVVVTSTLESGWTLYSMKTSGFALALPPGWERLDLNPSALATGLSIVGERNPKLKELFSSQTLRELAAAGIRFYGFDPSPQSLASGSPTSVNVLKLEIGVSLPLDPLVSLTLEQLKGMADPATPITHRRVTLSNVEAEEIQYREKLTSVTGEQVQLRLMQFLMVDGTTEYVVTCATSTQPANDQATVLEKIGKSFRLLK